MAIFRRRPLFLCCSALMIACLTGFFLRNMIPLAVTGGVIAIGGGVLLWRYAKRRNLTRICIVVAVLILSCLGILRTHTWFYGSESAVMSSLEGQTVRVSGIVTDRRGSGSYMTS